MSILWESVIYKFYEVTLLKLIRENETDTQQINTQGSRSRENNTVENTVERVHPAVKNSNYNVLYRFSSVVQSQDQNAVFVLLEHVLI